jgi:hypothetical protein
VAAKIAKLLSTGKFTDLFLEQVPIGGPDQEHYLYSNKTATNQPALIRLALR